MSESFSNDEIEEIILDNKDLVEEREEPFGVDREKLKSVFSRLDSFNNVENKRDRIVRKASHILAEITWNQPFRDGNKEIALSVTKLFLRKNGLDFSLASHDEKREIFDLLIRTVFKFEGDPSIVSELEDYLSRKIMDY